MSRFIYIITSITLYQLLIILISIIMLFFVQLFLNLYQQYRIKKTALVESYLHKLDNHSQSLIPIAIFFLKHSIPDILQIIDEKKQEFKDLNQLLAILLPTILKPQRRKYVEKSSWLKRYLAARCFLYGIDQDDEKYLLKLLNDETLLIVLNTGRVIFKFPTKTLVNALITIFSAGRHVQQTTFIDILLSDQCNLIVIESLTKDRLQSEKNIYAKIFCYRILASIPQSLDLITVIQRDLKSDSIELKIAIANYLSLSANQILQNSLVHMLGDDNWEVRAVASKMVFGLPVHMILSSLQKNLFDTNWWVRINAAQTLAKLGSQGVTILRNIRPQTDKYAYEAAQCMLIILEKESPQREVK